MLSRKHAISDDATTREQAPQFQSHQDLEALRKENSELRKLVVELSSIVIRGVADRK
ncbi:MAG TPA: hypothetical protein VFP60_09640 [Pseudolabrys sp.]|nr:hypothetical protein [Pseudolabrys sp.]